MRSAAHARRLRQVLRRAAGLTVPVLLTGGLLLPAGVPARLQIKGSAGLTYRAAGRLPGLVISPAGLITGTGRTPGSRTVTVTATSASGGHRGHHVRLDHLPTGFAARVSRCPERPASPKGQA
jgi:putative Ig domain-containing protein